MGNHRRRAALSAVGFAAAVCALGLAAAPARAQRGPVSGPPPPGNRDPFAESRERRQREAQLRSVGMAAGAPRKSESRGSEAAAEQMREDFRRIQILRNNVVRHLQSEKPLDYKFIASETEEINRRAARLKTHLVREPDEGEKGGAGKDEREKHAELGDGEVQGALVRMCKRIDSFTENPMFKVPEVVDLEQTAKAGRDLRDIIQLSGGIRRAAERQQKANKK
jgi:hypothetical protein